MKGNIKPRNDEIDSVCELIRLFRELSDAVGRLAFGPTVAYAYNPLEYARTPFETYLSAYGKGTGKSIFLGMNPGPWGMLQTGIPFGEVGAVREWLGIAGKVDQPESVHPKRPVQGFACMRREASGRRLWGLFRNRFATPREFFKDHFVINYCPLGFFDKAGTNVTPDKLPKQDRDPLLEICDEFLLRVISALAPRCVIGVGRFAESRLKAVLGDERTAPTVVGILHPSPASPAANQGWEAKVTRTLTERGVWQ